MDNSPKAIALVTCSIRNPRLNPFITDYVHQILTRYNSSNNNNNNNNNSENTISAIFHGPPTSLEVLDIADQHLPLSTDEPAIPAHLPESDPTPHYVNEYSRVWSSKVKRYDAFIFVTPQYNWSIPASLKNALDYLFHEWTGKPAGIVSYGGRGGGKAAEHLRGILSGLRMRPVLTVPELDTEVSMAGECVRDGRLGDWYVAAWHRAGLDDRICQMWEEVLSELRV